MADLDEYFVIVMWRHYANFPFLRSMWVAFLFFRLFHAKKIGNRMSAPHCLVCLYG